MQKHSATTLRVYGFGFSVEKKRFRRATNATKDQLMHDHLTIYISQFPLTNNLMAASVRLGRDVENLSRFYVHCNRQRFVGAAVRT